MYLLLEVFDSSEFFGFDCASEERYQYRSCDLNGEIVPN